MGRQPYINGSQGNAALVNRYGRNLQALTQERRFFTANVTFGKPVTELTVKRAHRREKRRRRLCGRDDVVRAGVEESIRKYKTKGRPGDSSSVRMSSTVRSASSLSMVSSQEYLSPPLGGTAACGYRRLTLCILPRKQNAPVKSQSGSNCVKRACNKCKKYKYENTAFRFSP